MSDSITELDTFVRVLRRGIAERLGELDEKNRKALSERDYLLNCGRIRELEELTNTVAQAYEDANKSSEELFDDEDEEDESDSPARGAGTEKTKSKRRSGRYPRR